MDIQTISIALAGIGIFLAAINFIVSSRQANQQRQMELLMQLYDRYSQPEFAKRWYTITEVHEWKDYDDYLVKYGPLINIDEASVFLSIGRFFEGLGVLVQGGFVDIDKVNALMYSQIVIFWKRYEHIIKETRVRFNNPTFGDHIEYLYDEITKYHTDDVITPTRTRNFR